jgi:hypothetical protein
MKKLIRNLEKNAAYDSDDEKNPYASSAGYLAHEAVLVLMAIIRKLKRRRKRKPLHRTRTPHNLRHP